SGLVPMTYTVTMTATASNGQPCSGSGPFTVVAGQTALVDVILQCTRVVTYGSVAITGRTDQCPVITSISATRLQAPVGGTINLGVVASELDPGDTVAYSWSASAAIGTFSSPSVAMPLFQCTQVGATSVSIAITDGICGDTLMNAIPITC